MAEKADDDKCKRKWFLLTFIKFTDKTTSLILLSDCVEEFALETTVMKNGSNGFREITGSRSSERDISEEETISITFGGELKSCKTTSLKIGKDYVINPVTVALKVNKNANYCIIHYEGNKMCTGHNFYFSLTEERQMLKKFKTRKLSESETSYHTGNINAAEREQSVPSSEQLSLVTEVEYEERQTFLQELCLKRYQFLVSSVYRCDADDEAEVSIHASLLTKSHTVETIYAFSYFVLRGGKWFMFPANYCTINGSVGGKVSSEDVFCAVAEFTAETMTVGKNGGSFISEKDNRVQVNIPEGALEKETDFTFRLETVDLDRHRVYGEQVPAIFECLVGLPTSLSIEHGMKVPLKQKAQVHLPIIRDGEEKDTEVLFLHWEKDTATPLVHKEDTSLPETSFYVDVDNFSTVSALTKRVKSSVEETIRATRILRGQASICIVLTYVVPMYMRGMPGLMVDCVELTRIKSVTKDYDDEGYKELPGSRSKDCALQECGYVSVDVGGNIQLEPGIRKKDIRLRFFRNNTTNRIVFPIKQRNPSQPLSQVIYTANKKLWVHRVYFSVSDYVGKNAFGRQQSKSSKSKSKMPTVLSEKSLSTLGRCVPESTWHEIGIELELTSDDLKRLFESKSSPSVGFALLKKWLHLNSRKSPDVLVEALASAFAEIERVDIADVVRNSSERDEPIRRRDFSGETSRDEKSSATSQASTSASTIPSTSDAKPKPFKA